MLYSNSGRGWDAIDPSATLLGKRCFCCFPDCRLTPKVAEKQRFLHVLPRTYRRHFVSDVCTLLVKLAKKWQNNLAKICVSFKPNLRFSKVFQTSNFLKTLCHRKVTTLWKWPKSKSARFTYGWNPPPQVTNGPYRVWSWVGPLGPGGPILILGGPKAHFFSLFESLITHSIFAIAQKFENTLCRSHIGLFDGPKKV